MGIDKKVYRRIFRSLRLARNHWAGLFDNSLPTCYPLVRGDFHFYLIQKILRRTLGVDKELNDRLFVLFSNEGFTKWY